ncbi:response regulator [Desertivirga brevis]|uniref:response regulator n=1 Tax=Desertivirga brevis TaxID=2810310 RepID=UPI001A96B976|nr:response regulator [Pedobacter sp. SYSU D00873]
MKKRILVIDDDNSILDVVKESLEYLDYEVETNSTGENVFRLIEEYKPDLILLDYLLNGINGGEFCHQIKTNPTTAHIPVIMMSGFPKVFLSLGDYKSDYFITKPFDLTELSDKISACLGKTTLTLP